MGCCLWGRTESDTTEATWRQQLLLLVAMASRWQSRTTCYLSLRGSVQFSSVAQSYLTLCDPMNCSTPLRLDYKVKEESENVGLKLNIQKTKIMASGPITSWQIEGETVETVSDIILGGLQNHCRW